MKEIKESMGLSAGKLMCLLFGLLLLPISSAQAPPEETSTSNEMDKECIFYAYTKSMNHNFLISNNSSQFGERIYVVHNCEFVEVRSDGSFLGRSNNSFNLVLGSGLYNLTFETNEEKIAFFDLTFYPDSLEWEGQYNQFMNPSQNKEFIELDLSNEKQNWAVGISILMVWILSTFIYWKLIESYVDKNFIEEVVQ